MSKKQKAAGKAGNKSRKAAVAVKKHGKAATKAPARKSSAKSPSKSVKKAAKKVKSVVSKAVKTVAKKALSASKSNGSSKSTKKKEIVTKVIKAVVKAVLPKKKQKPVDKAPAKKALKSPEKSQGKKSSASQLKPAVAVPAKTSKTQVMAPAVKAAKNGQDHHVAAKSKAHEPVPPKNAEAPDKGRKLNDLFTKKPLDRKPNDVLAITNTIPVKAKSEISPSKIASISYSITNPVRKTDSYAVKPEKEPQGKFELEFVVHASAEMLYEFLSTPSGLSEWFCDDLNIRNGIYTFIWDDQLQQARLLKTVDQQLVRFQWVDKTDGSYFEFRIQRDDLTNDISLIITDFADTSSERESSKLLWNSQVEKLMHVIGSIF